jgi:glycosyltransferase involved in cell wall biosynthesis
VDAQPRTDEATGPSVAILLPVLDEEAHVGACLDSIAAQDWPGPLDVLVIDGGSTDGTASEVTAAQGRAPHVNVRMLRNPAKIQSAALQAGLEATAADIVVRMDAHSVYDPDYVRRCVDALESGAAHGVVGVGGLLRAVGTTDFGKAVAAAMAMPGAIGPGAFHHTSTPVDADTTYLGAYRRATLENVGGWDTALPVGEDAELNWRLRRTGGKILVDPSIRSTYRPRETPAALAKQFFRYGVAKGALARRERALPSWRPLAPAALVAVVGGAALTNRRRLAAFGLGAYALFVTRLVRTSADPPRTAAAAAIMHVAYGAGVWIGLARG